MKHISLVFILMIIILASAGCTTSPVCITSSVTPMEGKVVEENLGRCHGSDTAYSFLGLFMFGKPDLDAAIKDALKEKKGDTLINVRCYETTGYFIIFSATTVTVEGEAVRLAGEEAQSGRRRR